LSISASSSRIAAASEPVAPVQQFADPYKFASCSICKRRSGVIRSKLIE
jgi:hypothetical protein